MEMDADDGFVATISQATPEEIKTQADTRYNSNDVDGQSVF
jgi:hypothetical protein